jgi:hypothetical protein
VHLIPVGLYFVPLLRILLESHCEFTTNRPVRTCPLPYHIALPRSFPANTGAAAWARCLLPLARLPSGFNPYVSFQKTSKGSPDLHALHSAVGLGGVLASTAAALAAATLAPAPVAAATVLVAALAVASDLPVVRISGSASSAGAECGPSAASVWRFYCGNFGFILTTSEAETGIDVANVLEKMTHVCQNRGAQSGGVVSLMVKGEESPSPAVEAFRTRVAAARRDNLAVILAKLYRKQSVIRRLKGAKVSTATMDRGMFLGHTRFATSSMPSAGETHPHQWTPSSAIAVNFWKVDANGTWVVRRGAEPGIFITHNGDFEFYRLFGVERTFGQVQKWLTAVLGTPSPAMCDSVGIGGKMEYLRTQGLWPQSLRLAYQQVVAETFDEAYNPLAGKCGPPSWSELKSAGAIVERTFESFIAKGESTAVVDNAWSMSERMLLALDTAGGSDALASAIEAALFKSGTGGAPWLKAAAKKGAKFSQAAVSAFVDNDLFTAVQKFFASARGSFGFVCGCQLEVGSFILSE